MGQHPDPGAGLRAGRQADVPPVGLPPRLELLGAALFPSPKNLLVSTTSQAAEETDEP